MIKISQILTQAKYLAANPDETVASLGSEHGNFSQTYKLVINGQYYALKSYSAWTPRSKIQRKLGLAHLEKNVGGLAYRLRYPEVSESGSENVKLETTVLKNWKEAQIKAPIIIAKDKNNLLLSFIEGESYEQIVQTGQYSRMHQDSLIKKIRQIRSHAYKTRNSYQLHNDLVLPNMMFDGHEAIPIDPALPFKKELGFETLDASFNLVFAYTLISPMYGYGSSTHETFDYILKGFLQTLDVSTITQMEELNTPANRFEIVYLKTTNALFGMNPIYSDFIEIFSPSQCRRIETELKKRVRKQESQFLKL
ncbi:hypothetical protein H8D36_00235 [archaeon]|nr:hypothetical protein [archaeon]